MGILTQLVIVEKNKSRMWVGKKLSYNITCVVGGFRIPGKVFSYPSTVLLQSNETIKHDI